MAYTSNFVYTRAIGEFRITGAKVEEWQVGWKIPTGSAQSSANLLAYLTNIATPVNTYWTNSNIGGGSAAFLTKLTAAYIGTDGKYVGGGAQSTTELAYGTPAPGGGTSNRPFTDSLVVSLRTAKLRGPGSNGRMYWPATSIPMGDTGFISTSLCQAIATAARTLLDSLNGVADTYLNSNDGVSVMSNVGGGTTQPVTSVRIGSKLDRQERREKQRVETYATSLLTTRAALRAAAENSVWH